MGIIKERLCRVQFIEHRIESIVQILFLNAASNITNIFKIEKFTLF